MKDLMRKAFENFLYKHGVFVDSDMGSNDIRCMLEEDLQDINQVAYEHNCDDWFGIFIELRDEMLDNEEIISVMITTHYGDVFLYLFYKDKSNLFDNLFHY